MASVDVRKRRIGAKIVYYGPGMSGKSANLCAAHSRLDPSIRGKLVSLAVKKGDSTYIDVLAVKFGKVGAFDVTFSVCAVPGQAFYNSTRRLLLKGTDGVVFVADSRPGRLEANLVCLEELKQNLETHELDIERLPYVLQYNKRDLKETVSVAELRSKLNHYGVLEFQASALTGQGVMETLKAITGLVCKDIEERL